MKTVLGLITLLCIMLTQHSLFASDMASQTQTNYPYQSSVRIQEEFLGGVSTTGQIGTHGWNSAGTITFNSSAANRPGLYKIDTGAVSGTTARINYGNTSAFSSSSLNHSVLFIFRVNTNDANTTVRSGSANSVASNPPNDGIYFEKLDADTNWFCVTRAGSVQTRTDSGVAVNTSFNTLKYVINSGTATFFINGTLVCTNSTNITTAQMSPYLYIINSAAASKNLDVDYHEFNIFNLTR